MSVRLLRTPWPRELGDAVSAAARQATGSKEDVLAAVQLTNGRWVAGTRATIYLPSDSANANRQIGWEQIERAN